MRNKSSSLFLIVAATSDWNRRRSALDGGLSIEMGTVYGCIKGAFFDDLLSQRSFSGKKWFETTGENVFSFEG